MNPLNIVVGFQDRFSKKFAKFTKNVEKDIMRADRFATNAVMSISAPIITAGAGAVAAAAKVERLETSFKSLVGSAENGAIWFKKLMDFSARTPLQIEQILKSVNIMQGFGMSIGDAAGSMKMLGNISALTGANLTQMSIAYGQAFAEGRAMTRDLTQLVNQDIPIWGALSDITGKTTSQLRDMAKEGKITFDLLADAMRHLTGEGGKFEDGLQKVADTTFGKLTTMKDRLMLAFAGLGMEIINSLGLKDIIDDIGVFALAVTKTFQEMPQGTKDAIVNFTKWLVLVPVIIKSATLLARAFVLLGKTAGKTFQFMLKMISGKGLGKAATMLRTGGIWGAVIVGITALAVYLYNTFDEVSRVVNTLYYMAKALFTSLGTVGVNAVKALWYAVTGDFDKAKEAWADIAKDWTRQDEEFKAGLADVQAGNTKPLEDDLTSLKDTLMDGLFSMGEAAKEEIMSWDWVGDIMTQFDALQANIELLNNQGTNIPDATYGRSTLSPLESNFMPIQSLNQHDYMLKQIVGTIDDMRVAWFKYRLEQEKIQSKMETMGTVFQDLLYQPFNAFWDELFNNNEEKLNAFDVFIRSMIDMLKQLAAQLLTTIVLAGILSALTGGSFSGAFGAISGGGGGSGFLKGLGDWIFGGGGSGTTELSTRSQEVNITGTLSGRDIKLSQERYNQTSTRQRIG